MLLIPEEINGETRMMTKRIMKRGMYLRTNLLSMIYRHLPHPGISYFLKNGH